jgi:hypothetical protein
MFQHFGWCICNQQTSNAKFNHQLPIPCATPLGVLSLSVRGRDRCWPTDDLVIDAAKDPCGARVCGTLLVALFLFQLGGGVATHSDVRPMDRFHTFQIAREFSGGVCARTRTPELCFRVCSALSRH